MRLRRRGPTGRRFGRAAAGSSLMGVGKFVVCLPLLYYSLSKGDVVFHERLMRGPWCRALERRDERASESAYFFAFLRFFFIFASYDERSSFGLGGH